jgi:hypothetical protein
MLHSGDQVTREVLAMASTSISGTKLPSPRFLVVAFVGIGALVWSPYLYRRKSRRPVIAQANDYVAYAVIFAVLYGIAILSYSVFA